MINPVLDLTGILKTGQSGYHPCMYASPMYGMSRVIQYNKGCPAMFYDPLYRVRWASWVEGGQVGYRFQHFNFATFSLSVQIYENICCIIFSLIIAHH